MAGWLDGYLALILREIRTLVRVQRTRGVLRLMAAVIHSLREKGDRNPLILPENSAIDDPRVQLELTRYLSDNRVPVIKRDVDGPHTLPLRLDREVPNLGRKGAQVSAFVVLRSRIANLPDRSLR